MTTLEGRLKGTDFLEGVQPGDVVLLQGNNGNVAGYVAKMSAGIVELSPGDPHQFLNEKVLIRGIKGPENRFQAITYRISNFDSYAILRKRGGE